MKKGSKICQHISFWHRLSFWPLSNTGIKRTFRDLLAQRWQVSFTLVANTGWLVVTAYNDLLRRNQKQLPSLVEEFQWLINSVCHGHRQIGVIIVSGVFPSWSSPTLYFYIWGNWGVKWLKMITERAFGRARCRITFPDPWYYVLPAQQIDLDFWRHV